MAEALRYKTHKSKIDDKSDNGSEKKFKISEKIFMAFMIAFAASAMNYEAYIPEKLAVMYRILLWSVCAITWIVISFESGMKGKWQFELFVVLYLIIPQVVIFLNDSGPEFFRFSMIAYSLSQFSQLLLLQPVYMLGNKLDLGDLLVSAIYIGISIAIFFVGYFVSKKGLFKKGSYTGNGLIINTIGKEEK